MTISHKDFNAWRKAMGYTIADAAKALGRKTRQCSAYSNGTEKVPACVQLAMLHILATGQTSDSLPQAFPQAIKAHYAIKEAAKKLNEAFTREPPPFVPELGYPDQPTDQGQNPLPSDQPAHQGQKLDIAKRNRRYNPEAFR